MSLDACANIVARGDPNRFRAVMAAPVAARAKLLPLFAFNVEVARAPWVTQEVMIAEMRLQWWRDVLEEITQAQPVRRHEVATSLGEVLNQEDAKVFDALVDARRWDIYKNPFEDQPDLDSYLEDTSAGLMWVSAHVLGGDLAKEQAYRAVGWASGLAALFEAIPELERQGRKPLVDGRPEAVAELAQRGLIRLREGLVAGANGPAIYPAWRAGALLRQADKDPRKVANGTLKTSEFYNRFNLLRCSLVKTISP